VIKKEQAAMILEKLDEKPVTTSFSISLALYVLLKAYMKARGQALSDYAFKALEQQLLNDLEKGDGIPEELVAKAVEDSAQVPDKRRVLEKMGLQKFVRRPNEVALHAQRITTDKTSMAFMQAFDDQNLEITADDLDGEPAEKSLGKTTKKELIKLVRQLCEDTAKLRDKLSTVETDLKQIKSGKSQH